MNDIIENHIQEAIDAVSAWEIQEADFAEAVNAQAGLDIDQQDSYVAIAVHAHLHG